MAGWQSGHAADCKSVYAGSIPTPASSAAPPANFCSMNSMPSRAFGRIAALALLIGAPASWGAEPPDGKALATELFTYLGLDQTRRGQLESGEVVHNGLSKAERLPDEIVAAGAMLIVKAPQAAVVIDAFLHSETFQRIFQVRRQAVQGGAAELAAFITLPIPEPSRLRDIVNAPARYMNLSKSEAETLKSLNTITDDLQTRFRAALAQILIARLNAYASHGLAGVQPYVRDNGSVLNPASELSNAIRSLAFLADEFPGFIDTLGRPSGAASSAPVRNYFWMERRVDKENVLALSVEERQRQAKAAVGADVHFYASRDYNSMLTLVGVVPYGEDWMVFAINHTFTDQVTGFGSGVRRAVGRDLVATELGKQLAETRRRLTGLPAQR